MKCQYVFSKINIMCTNRGECERVSISLRKLAYSIFSDVYAVKMIMIIDRKIVFLFLLQTYVIAGGSN